MKTNLISILWKKEIVHWKRVKQMFGKINGWVFKVTLGVLVVLLVTLAHYAFALMHTLYEMFLFIFARQAFKANLQKMALKV
jgi:hypothetical protein